MTPDEAIGAKADENFVIKKGLDRVIEARFRGESGQAFTDAPGNWEGTLSELLDLHLEESRNRAFFTAGLNAVLCSSSWHREPCTAKMMNRQNAAGRCRNWFAKDTEPDATE